MPVAACSQASRAPSPSGFATEWYSGPSGCGSRVAASRMTTGAAVATPAPPTPAWRGQRPSGGEQQNKANAGDRNRQQGGAVHRDVAGGRQCSGPGQQPIGAYPSATPLADTDSPRASSSQPTGWRGRRLASTAPTVVALRIPATAGTPLGFSGLADLRAGEPMRPDLHFRAGSMTKSLVATVVLQLVAEGRLSLEDTVDRWLPGILPYGDQLTIRRLLNHTSGVPDYVATVYPTLYGSRQGRLRTALSPS
jgi:beta-lactamase family protein